MLAKDLQSTLLPMVATAFGLNAQRAGALKDLRGHWPVRSQQRVFAISAVYAMLSTRQYVRDNNAEGKIVLCACVICSHFFELLPVAACLRSVLRVDVSECTARRPHDSRFPF